MQLVNEVPTAHCYMTDNKRQLHRRPRSSSCSRNNICWTNCIQKKNALRIQIEILKQRCTGAIRLLSKFQTIKLLFRLVSKMKRNCWTRPSREELIERGSVLNTDKRRGSNGFVEIATSSDNDQTQGGLRIASRYDSDSERVVSDQSSSSAKTTCHLPDFKERVSKIVDNIPPFIPSYPLEILKIPHLINHDKKIINQGKGQEEHEPNDSIGSSSVPLNRRQISSDLEDGEIFEEERQNCEFPIKFLPRKNSGSRSHSYPSTSVSARPDSSSIAGTEWSIDGICPIINSSDVEYDDIDQGYEDRTETRSISKEERDKGRIEDSEEECKDNHSAKQQQQHTKSNDEKIADYSSKLIVPAKYRGGRAYELLGLTRTDVRLGRVTDKDIKKAYRKRAVATHPDKGGEHSLMQDLNETNDFLTKHKVAYDEISGIRDRNGRAGSEYNDL